MSKNGRDMADQKESIESCFLAGALSRVSKSAFRLVCTATNVEHDIGFYSATVGSFADCVRLRLLWCSSDFTTSTLLSTRTATLRKQKAKHGFRDHSTKPAKE